MWSIPICDTFNSYNLRAPLSIESKPLSRILLVFRNPLMFHKLKCNHFDYTCDFAVSSTDNN
jgi:hypothetical protein